MGNKRVTTEDFISRAKHKHGCRYDYSKVEYKGTHAKVKILCNIHGEFEQTPHNHLCSSGCLKCANRKQAMDIYEFLIKAREVHNIKYKYDKTDYYNIETSIVITCPTHGDFNQIPRSHLSGKGCSKCGNIGNGGYSRTRYIEKAKSRLCTFYTLKCFNENEEFYKIGITMNSVKKRYRTLKEMPYSYEIISEIHGEAGFIWDLELSEKRKLKKFHYEPNIEFDGSKTECFTQYIKI